MAEIFPFRAYRFDAARGDLARMLTQPYDKITPEMQERYYSLDPHNLIVVEKGKSQPEDTLENNVYTRAAQALNDWIARGVLVRDPTPSIYVHFQEYRVPHTGETKVRRGFIALGRLLDYSAGVVFRHEQTLAAPKADRRELLRHTRAHTGQLFILYSDPNQRLDALLEQISRRPPPVQVGDEFNVVHRLWPVSDRATIERFRSEMADKKLVIADGHHRYETALAYRDECRARGGSHDPDAPHEKAMMTFFNACAEGLTILPTHRVVSGLPRFDFERFIQQLQPYFEASQYRFATEATREPARTAFRREFESARPQRRAIGLYAPGAFCTLVLRADANLAALLPDLSPAQRHLDVVLLHRLVLEKGLGITSEAVQAEQFIRYEREMEAALAAVERGAAQLACLLNPVRIEQVMQMALAGEVLPQKSTDFYPKLLSGLTIYRLDG